MILTVQQVQDYIKCPMLYKYRYVDEIYLYSEDELFRMAIKQVVDQMYYSLLDGIVPDKAFVKYKWGDAWDLQIDKNKIMWMPYDTKRRLQMRGLDIVLGIQEYVSKVKPYPISINDIYGIQVGSHRIETDMSYVQEVKGEIGLIEYVVNDYIPDDTSLINNLPITAKAMIFEDVFKTRLKRMSYFSTKNNTLYPTWRNKSDFTELKQTVSMIAHCVNHKIFYKQYSEACRTCPYYKYCNR
ncbi:MAG TPA: hypothetical protein VK190_02935 [Pseudoneobacillus sp.]|nr:hypothetical protein [Pseudoneobacillus sp.]